MPLISFWIHYCQLNTHFTSCLNIISVSIADLDQEKSRLGSKIYHSKKT